MEDDPNFGPFEFPKRVKERMHRTGLKVLRHLELLVDDKVTKKHVDGLETVEGFKADLPPPSPEPEQSVPKDPPSPPPTPPNSPSEQWVLKFRIGRCTPPSDAPPYQP
jgi:hypothetical protein